MSYQGCDYLCTCLNDFGDGDGDDDDIDGLSRSVADLSLRATEASGSRNAIKLAEGFFLPRGLYDQLYPYQREGVSWLWNLHKTAPGGIVADDMGLGKTLQTIAFLTGYFLSEGATKKPPTAIILAPVSVLQTWQSEFSKWSPSMRLVIYYEMAKNARRHALLSFQSRGGILLTTYNMLVSGIHDIAADQHYRQTEPSAWLSSNDPQVYIRAFTYDYVILDEAHRIKNPSTQVAKAVRTLDCRHRLLLTGTAIQNNLRELWSLFDFTHAGRLLGSQKTFLLQYEKPILRSRERDASAAERLHGNLMTESLNKMIKPFLLRRTKKDTLAALLKGTMPCKNEIVVWVYLSDLQEHIYRSFLRLDHVKELLFGGNTQRSPLVELTILKKLCDHPRLLSTQQCANLGLDVSKALPGSEIRAPSYKVLLQESGKMAFVVRLLEHFQEEALRTGEPAHRTLIFSQSLRLLNMVEASILGLNRDSSRSPELPLHRILRLDGRLKPEERVAVLERFADDQSYTAMLLTTQVGGVGLTITSADRVVILDPSWNPSVDAQAVDRVYRIGQQSNVVVYRLITCATVEEKIYRRQVFKDSVIRQTMGRAAADRPVDADVTDPYRYFTRQELVELFRLDENAHFSATQRQLAELHSTIGRRTYPQLESHLAFLKSMTDLLFDISDHDLLFSRREDANAIEETEAERLFAENRLKVGEAALKMEAAQDFVGSKKIQRQVYAPSKPAYNRPAGDIFIPSKRDTQRAMFNAPGCGRANFLTANDVFKERHVIQSKDNLGNGSKQTCGDGKGAVRPPVIGPRLISPEPSRSPAAPTASASNDLIKLDPTEMVDDATIDNSMQLVSLRKSLAMSGIFLSDDAASTAEEGEPKDDVMVGDSCCEETDEGSGELHETSVAETSSDSVEIIEASFLDDE
uniref:DNA excision repair protein ERCC-6 n=1 Tax=Taenia asiatica TaxID=60517 RepID=A0A0R3WBW6_TAEAS